MYMRDSLMLGETKAFATFIHGKQQLRPQLLVRLVLR